MTSEKSMYGFLDEAVHDKAKDKIIYFNKKIKGDELFSHIDSLAFYLIKQGVKKGDSVGICLPNIPQAVISLYAINRIGAVANVIHPKMSGNALVRILENTNTKVVFVFDKMIKNFQTLIYDKKIKMISCSASYYLKGFKKWVASLLEPQIDAKIIQYGLTISEKGDISREVSPYEPAVYLHSGGTTGEPKVVVLSSYAFNELVLNVISSTSKNHKY
ncbi:MAG: AMP-binding protein, partial [Bacillota bacterium]